ncbi:NAD(P)H-dependent oxidoreductase [Peredibacter starrii]|uniref:NAD(P)H-dependent oxidoreductase n=1 Tax=Peredibacter starrii TaxID=28202 RepID=A0AAX4HK45_9BACT|nr:NAD(P)H-dependent oxidoreductase [Peredibacter starrii]WPU63572.1 NAD(P)H-dependent oxidoreductase [Peredibacter starrii]
MKNILIVNGHPSKTSLSGKLAEAYYEESNKAGFKVEIIHLGDLEFDPVLHEGYRVIQELEPALIEAQAQIKSAHHIVFVTPVWWGSIPALFKGFIDRTFLPGFAFKYRKGSSLWDKLLAGKSARLIILSDGPTWWNKFVYKDPAVNMLKKSTLEFSGFKVDVTKFGDIKNRNDQSIQTLIHKVQKLGTSGS